MKFAPFVITALALGAAAATAEAQSPLPFSLEVRGDAAIPVGSFADRADVGVGFTASAAVAVMPSLGVYGSYSRTEFGLKDADGTAVASGFGAGLTTALPAFGAARPWVGAGVLFHELDEAGTSAGDLGFEVGGGIAVPLGERVRVTPGVGYRQFGVADGVNVSYVSAGVGLNVAF